MRVAGSFWRTRWMPVESSAAQTAIHQAARAILTDLEDHTATGGDEGEAPG